jgi:tetratricopeptide (TPR) repeat protein
VTGVRRAGLLILGGLCLCRAAVAGTGTTAGDYVRRSHHVRRPERRIELLDRALELNSRHVTALKERSGLYYLIGKKKQAFDDARRAADLAPEDPGIQVRAALLADELREYEHAARLLRRALTQEPDRLLWRARRIHALTQLLRVDEALGEANVMIEQRPDRDLPYSMRADVYEWADRYRDAVDDLTRLIRRHPEDSRYYLRRCINYRCLGEGRKALADAQKGMDLKGRSAYALAARGCSYEVLRELDKAFDDYQRAAQLDDDKRYFTIWCCLVRRKQGRREEADKLIRAFLKTLKNQDEWIAPVIKYLAGEMTEEEVFRLARHDDPIKNREQLCEAYYYIGACYLAEKKYGRAEELFRKTLAQRVHNFYEHGFAIRDLRIIKNRREKAAEPDKGRPE